MGEAVNYSVRLVSHLRGMQDKVFAVLGCFLSDLCRGGRGAGGGRPGSGSDDFK